MPTYEYRCKGCGQQLEVVQAFTDDPLTTCEACGGDLRKVFGSVGITFKGSGFYRTDSRSGSSSSNGSSSNGSSSSDSSSNSSDGASSTSSSDATSTSSSGGSTSSAPAAASA